MAFDIPQESKKFFEAGYEVLFHCSTYRAYDQRWACFLSGEKREYFNGDTTITGYGRSIEEAYEDYLFLKEEKEVVKI